MRIQNYAINIPWFVSVIVCSYILLVGMQDVFAEDRHAGYYYPIPATDEVYSAKTQVLADSDRRRRILFVTEMSNQMMRNPYPPPIAIFVKGAHGQKLVITALYSNSFDTIYRMRALLAILTAQARSTPLFQDLGVEDQFTFLDLLKMFGFERLTMTDGDRFAHQINIL